jgi:hypothetical protein
MADHTNTIPTPTRRAALSGSVAAVAGTALALLGGRSAAAVGLAGAGAALPAGADPALVLWRQYNDLLCRQELISDSAVTLRTILTARWGEASHATPAAILWATIQGTPS